MHQHLFLCDGLFRLHGNETGTSIGNVTDTIRNNSSWSWSQFFTGQNLHTGLLVSKLFFQVDYSNIDQVIKKINYTGFGGNNIAKFIDFQILADTLIIQSK